MIKKSFMVVLLMTALVACAPSIDPASFQVTPADKEKIAPLPKGVYAGTDWNVGVVEFENTTGIGPARSVTGTYQRSSAAAVGFTSGGIGVASASQGSASVTDTEIIPKIGNMAATATEEVLMGLGGVKVFSRTSLNKIFDEQKLQASGMVNEASMVKLGQLAGLTHIITGSINNVKKEYGKGSGAVVGLALLNAAAGTNAKASNRWRLDVDTTIKIISVETGQVMFSKSFTAVETADGSAGENRPDFFLGIAQAALKEALSRSRVELAKMFPLRAYIQQMKGGKQAILINVGTKQGINPGDEFKAFEFESIEDPVSGKKELSKTEVTAIKVADKVTESSAWAIPADKEQAKRLKLGMLVEKSVTKGFMQGMKEGTEFLK